MGGNIGRIAGQIRWVSGCNIGKGMGRCKYAELVGELDITRMQYCLVNWEGNCEVDQGTIGMFDDAEFEVELEAAMMQDGLGIERCNNAILAGELGGERMQNWDHRGLHLGW